MKPFHYQTDAMRWCVKLYRTKDRACTAYALLEAQGFVKRRRNAYKLSGYQYANSLYNTMVRYNTLKLPMRQQVEGL
jgi:hypothetical protein